MGRKERIEENRRELKRVPGLTPQKRELKKRGKSETRDQREENRTFEFGLSGTTGGSAAFEPAGGESLGAGFDSAALAAGGVATDVGGSALVAGAGLLAVDDGFKGAAAEASSLLSASFFFATAAWAALTRSARSSPFVKGSSFGVDATYSL